MEAKLDHSVDFDLVEKCFSCLTGGKSSDAALLLERHRIVSV